MFDRENIEKPIILIGTGRSGSTILFEALAVHEDLGWLSNFNDRFPQLDIIAFLNRVYDLPFAGRLPRGEKRQYKQGRAWWNKFLPKPSEGYGKWRHLCGEAFLHEFLNGVRANQEQLEKTHRSISAILRWQGKHRFVAKLTGPSRIEFLLSLFPDALFVHLTRNCQAVVRSALDVDKWRPDFDPSKPLWIEALPQRWEQEWETYDRSIIALAAMQYRGLQRNLIEEKKLVKPECFLEIRYEEFVTHPVDCMHQVLAFCELSDSRRVGRLMSAKGKYKNMNKKVAREFSAEDRLLIERIVNV